MENKKKGVSLEGASGQKTSFSFPSIVGACRAAADDLEFGRADAL